MSSLLELYQGYDFGKHRAKIAFRMTRGPTDSCIRFHCDGPYAQSTTQIALNDSSEYRGGRLVYFEHRPSTPNKLSVLERTRGTMTHHTPKVLHAVTRMVSGTRKSMFILDEANGLGDSNVITAEDAQVNAFLTTWAPPPRLPLPRNNAVVTAPAAHTQQMERLRRRLMGVGFDAVERVVRVLGVGCNGAVMECVMGGHAVALKVMYNYGQSTTMVSNVQNTEYRFLQRVPEHYNIGACLLYTSPSPRDRG